MHRILLKEGSGVVEALKAIRGPLFDMFLVAIDLRQARVCDAGDRCPVSILLSRSEEYCERQVWGNLSHTLIARVAAGPVPIAVVRRGELQLSSRI